MVVDSSNFDQIETMSCHVNGLFFNFCLVSTLRKFELFKAKPTSETQQGVGANDRVKG